MIKTRLSARTAGNILLLFLGLLAIFHILVLLNVVPPDIVWGGQASESANNLVMLESIALVVVALFALIIAAKVGYLNAGRFRRAVNVGVWLIFAYLLLNTIGNLASAGSAEKFIFAPLTLILSLIALRLALEK